MKKTIGFWLCAHNNNNNNNRNTAILSSSIVPACVCRVRLSRVASPVGTRELKKHNKFSPPPSWRFIIIIIVARHRTHRGIIVVMWNATSPLFIVRFETSQRRTRARGARSSPDRNGCRSTLHELRPRYVYVNPCIRMYTILQTLSIYIYIAIERYILCGYCICAGNGQTLVNWNGKWFLITNTSFYIIILYTCIIYYIVGYNILL